MPKIIEMGALRLTFLQTKQASEGSLDLFEMLLRPNARMPVPHYHESWDETIYGLAGVSSWRVADEQIEIAPGDTLFIRRGTVHGLHQRHRSGGVLPLHPDARHPRSRLFRGGRRPGPRPCRRGRDARGRCCGTA